MPLGGLGAKDILIQLKGDNKNLKNAMADSDKSMGKLTKSVRRYGPAMAAGLAVGSAAFIAMTVKMAAAEEVVNRQTESMLKSQGIMWSEVEGDVTNYINALEALTAYGDTDLQMAFNRMSSSGMGYNEVMKSMKMVTDIAYTRNIDLVAAADLVAKGYNGQGSSLKRYGIILEAGVTGMEAVAAMQLEVSKNFADASDRTDTFTGKLGLLETQSDDLKEALGVRLLPAATSVVEVLNKLMEPVPIDVQIDQGLIDTYTESQKMNLGLTEDQEKELTLLNSTNREGVHIIGAQTVEYEHQKKTREEMHRDALVWAAEDPTYDNITAYYAMLTKTEGQWRKADLLSKMSMEDRIIAANEYAKIQDDLLKTEEAITAEGEKQLGTMRERAAAAQKEIKSRKERIAVGSLGQGGREIAETGLKAVAGEAYTRQSGAFTITNPGKSGAP